MCKLASNHEVRALYRTEFLERTILFALQPYRSRTGTSYASIPVMVGSLATTHDDVLAKQYFHTQPRLSGSRKNRK